MPVKELEQPAKGVRRRGDPKQREFQYEGMREELDKEEGIELHHLALYPVSTQRGSQDVYLYEKGIRVGNKQTAEDMISSVAFTFQKRSLRYYGEFKSQGETSLKKKLDDYLDNTGDQDGEEKFRVFSLDAARILRSELEKAPSSEGSVFVVAHYSHEQRDYLLIVLMKLLQGFHFDAIQGEIDESSVLNINNLKYACRIDLTCYQDAKCTGKYISCVLGNIRVFANYFTNFLGVSDIRANTVSAYRLDVALREYLEEERDDLDDEEREQLRSLVVDKIKTFRGENVVLKNIADILNPADAKHALKFMQNKKYGLDNVMNINARAFQEQGYHSVRDKRMNIRVKRTTEGLDVRFPADQSDAMVIANIPPDLYHKLRETFGTKSI